MSPQTPPKRVIRQVPDVLRVDNPPPTPEMAEFAVKQEFKGEVDINKIMERMRNGIQPPPWMTANTPYYGDYSDMPASFQEAFAIVAEAESAFMALLLEMRKELDHNPQNLDQAPRELYEKYGLIRKKPVVDAGSGTPDPSAASGSPTEGRQQTKKPKAPQGAQNPPSGEKED